MCLEVTSSRIFIVFFFFFLFPSNLTKTLQVPFSFCAVLPPSLPAGTMQTCQRASPYRGSPWRKPFSTPRHQHGPVVTSVVEGN